MAIGTRAETTFDGGQKPWSDGDNLCFNQDPYNITSVGDLSLRCFVVTQRKDLSSDD